MGDPRIVSDSKEYWITLLCEAGHILCSKSTLHEDIETMAQQIYREVEGPWTVAAGWTGKRRAMILYHVTPKRNVARIRSQGLVPSRHPLRGGYVYLRDSWDFAAEFAMGAYPGIRLVMLKVRIPKSWVELDDQYGPEEAPHGHSWRTARKIPPERVSVVGEIRRGRARPRA